MSSRNSTLTQSCNCYKVASLTETILDTNQTSTLEDRYVLGEQLGWGQFGVIRTCSDKLTGEVLACKSIAKERLVTQDDVRSVKLEIEIMTRLSGHPNVVDIKAVYEEEDYVHLVMELCAGGELFHRLEKHGRFSESEAQALFSHLMQVVMYCHDKGIVHRDLKPENILLATRASSSPIKLADFGLATYIEPGQSLHGTVGSPFYIAPEVLTGGYNQAADVWSAGVILYILLSGMPPFWGKTKSRIFEAVRAADLRFPSEPWDRISASAKDLISGMLCTDPAKRLTAAQVLDHSWIKDCWQVNEEPNEHDSVQLDLGSSSFSIPLIARNMDFSFSSPISGNTQPGYSPAFTCRSSFSSFLVDPTTPCLVSGGFSFSSCCESSSLEFSSPVPSMPSFAFFSPSPVTEQRSNNSLDFMANVSGVQAVQSETSVGELILLSDSTVCLGQEGGQTAHNKVVDVRRGGVTPTSRVFGIHSKRNHTIGLGELEQLDLMVTESVIRWASCTHLPTAPSLRSSLVC
ncbi:PREDICTED: calcium-dependent protein kinase 26-like [Nelumbo nucifera]|uniref:non-specific serine/threonine protein kinase n=1 Tax=Nelumbo nucifera TaxID=4432 RepID=A0A1U8A1Q6_NELNU|nr:PREDICTED: calcium-dependent protein kinase 26-like [Nelumbo nucifera]